MLVVVDEGPLLLGIGAPQQEDHAPGVVRDPTNHGVRQLFPTLVLQWFLSNSLF